MEKFKNLFPYDTIKEIVRDSLNEWGQNMSNQDMDYSAEILNNIKYFGSFKLYKYHSPEYFNIRNLEKRQIFLSPNGNFNDIYEGLPNCDFSTLSNNELSVLNDLAYISCFSEDGNNILMWSHYAKAHTGFCIEYDLSYLKNKNPIKYLTPVLYEDKKFLNIDLADTINEIKTLNMCIYQDEAYDKNLLTQSLPLFMIKPKVWEYEKEWRLIYSKMRLYEMNQFTSISTKAQCISFDCISAIYLGYRINNEIKENILEIVKRINAKNKNKIAVYQSILSREHYQLEYDKIL